MKNMIITMLVLLASSQSNSAEDCKATDTIVKSEEVVYTVNSKLPKHLEGAVITITLANGKSSTVPAEKFMVVPRKQKTVLGENKTIKNKFVCSNTNKNSLIFEGRKDVTSLETEVTTINNGFKATTKSNKELVPGVNYYRREILDTPIGLGVGVDTNGTVKGLIGIDF